VGSATSGVGVLVGTAVVCIEGTWEGVDWGAPQATSSAMTAEKPSTHDNNRLAALKLTGFTCSVPAARGHGPHNEAHRETRRPNPWLIVLQNHLPVNREESGDDWRPEEISEVGFHDGTDLHLL
jgi:hypothetical protein